MDEKVWGFDDFHIGHEFAPFQYRISAAENAQFTAILGHDAIRATLGDGRAWTPTPTAPDAMQPIHPALVGSFQPQRAAFIWAQGLVHAREKVQLYAPAWPDELLQARVTVTDKYVKNGKRFIVIMIDIRKAQDNSLVMTIERIQAWLQ